MFTETSRNILMIANPCALSQCSPTTDYVQYRLPKSPVGLNRNRAPRMHSGLATHTVCNSIEIRMVYLEMS